MRAQAGHSRQRVNQVLKGWFSCDVKIAVLSAMKSWYRYVRNTFDTRAKYLCVKVRAIDGSMRVEINKCGAINFDLHTILSSASTWNKTNICDCCSIFFGLTEKDLQVRAPVNDTVHR